MYKGKYQMQACKQAWKMSKLIFCAAVVGQLCVSNMIGKADPLCWEEAFLPLGTLSVMTCFSLFFCSGFWLQTTHWPHGSTSQASTLQTRLSLEESPSLMPWGFQARHGRKEEKYSFKCRENQNLFTVETGREWRIRWTETLLHSFQFF